MRTTLDIEEDVLRAARSLAQARSVSLGKAVSELARQGLQHRAQTAYDDGIPVFRTSPGARPITLADVKRVEDEA